MASTQFKIYAPKPLETEGVTEASFDIWAMQLRVYLQSCKDFRPFLPGGRYAKWTSFEENPNQILTAVAPDEAANLENVRSDLLTFLTSAAAFVHQDYYMPIIKHSTSFDGILKKLKQDLNLQTTGVHFMNIIHLKYDIAGNISPIGFYNNYRSIILSGLKKKDTKIHWCDKTLSEDEKMSPTFEDFILIQVLKEIHPKLPEFIQKKYAHNIGTEKCLMDFKTDILTHVKEYIEEIENGTLVAAAAQLKLTDETDAKCNFVRTQFRPRNQFQRRFNRNPSNQKSFPSTPRCRLCQVKRLPPAVFNSHHIGDVSCPSVKCF